jgi:hypothetical protein
MSVQLHAVVETSHPTLNFACFIDLTEERELLNPQGLLQQAVGGIEARRKRGIRSMAVDTSTTWVEKFRSQSDSDAVKEGKDVC